MVTADALRRTAQRVIDGYNAWTEEGILGWRSEDCRHVTLPRSLKESEKGNEEVLAQFRVIKPLYRDFHLKVQTVTVDTASLRVVLHVRSTAQTAVGTYSNEYMITLWMTDDGKKVKRVEEFVDSRMSVKLTRVVEEQAGLRWTGGERAKL